MKLTTSDHRDVTVIHLQGNMMGGPDATLLNTKLHELVEAGKKQIIIDLHGVEFVNSSGLGLLIGGVSALKAAGGMLKLARASEKITALIKITKLSALFESYPSVEAAVKSVKK